MKRKKTPLYAFGKVVAQPVVWPFIPYTVKNWENIPQDRNFILCANHLAISDPLRLASIEKRQIFFLSKAELFQNKPLAWLLRSLEAGAGQGVAAPAYEEKTWTNFIR